MAVALAEVTAAGGSARPQFLQPSSRRRPGSTQRRGAAVRSNASSDAKGSNSVRAERSRSTLLRQWAAATARHRSPAKAGAQSKAHRRIKSATSATTC